MYTTPVDMIWDIKSMIAGCIDRMRADSCGDCERRDACSHLFSELFGRSAAGRPRAAGGEEPPRTGGGNFFLAMLGEVAKAVERSVQRGSVREPNSGGSAPSTRAAPLEPERRAAGGGRFRREVEAHLEPRLASGPIGIESVARELGYSRQTLYRRLKAEGVTFEEVLDGLRRRLALRLLREQGLSVKEAAWRLGFSDPAAFSRAFKRWTGAAPKAPRRDH